MRKLKVVLIILAVLLVLAGAAFGVVYHKLNQMQHVSKDEPPVTETTLEDLLNSAPENDEEIDGDLNSTPEEIEAADDALNEAEDLEVDALDEGLKTFLLLGSDSRVKGAYGNSDTMILATVNEKTGKIHLTSMMRAMYVKIPGFGNGMLNWSYQIGGPQLTMQTIEENFNVHIDDFFAVDFSSFEGIVDQLGGLDVELTYGEAGYINRGVPAGPAVGAGMSHLNGAQALAHARNRSLDNDFKRTGRQRALVTAIIQKARNASLTQLNGALDALLPYVLTDMPTLSMIGMLPNVVKWSGYEIDQLMLPVENMAGNSYTGMIYVNGHEMYAVDWENNLSKLVEFLNS